MIELEIEVLRGGVEAQNLLRIRREMITIDIPYKENGWNEDLLNIITITI
jgi:hypothetical protein